MNILFLTPRESGKNLGGVERHVRLLTEELRKRGHKVKELGLDEADKSCKDYKNYKDRTGRHLETSSRSHPVLFKLMAWRYLWDRLELFRWADIVHVHDVFWWYLPFGLLIKIKKILWKVPQHYAYLLLWLPATRRKSASAGYGRASGFLQSKNPGPSVFVTFHGWEGRCPPTRSAVWQKRLAAWLSDGTIGVGDFYRKWYGVKTDRVVWGVLAPAVRSLSSEASSLAPESVATAGFGRASGFLHEQKSGPVRRLAFFGRLEKVNGIEIVIEAAKSIKDSPRHTPGRILSIIFVGDGSYRKEAEKVGKVTGMVANPWRHLAGADIVIASSYLAILEAMAMGKPVIAVANNPLKRDYLEGHPLRRYFEVVGNSDELARLIMDKGYKGYKNYKEKEGKKNEGDQKDRREKGNAWALRQTVGKLADVYEELWNSKLA